MFAFYLFHLICFELWKSGVLYFINLWKLLDNISSDISCALFSLFFLCDFKYTQIEIFILFTSLLLTLFFYLKIDLFKRDDPNKIRNERGETTTDTTEIQRVVRNYYEQLYAKKFEHLGEIDRFLEKYNLPKLNQEESESPHRPITAGEIDAVIEKLPSHKSPLPDSFTGEFYKTFKGELTPILLRLFKKSKKREDSQTLFMKSASF